MQTAGLSERRASRLVGRGRELAQLDTALDGALAGRGSLVLLTGEPGIGKTALAREFVEHASAKGAAWAWGSCWDGGGAPAYWPWVQVGRALARRADRSSLRAALGAGAPWIAGLLPELADTLGAPAQPSELDSDQARFRLFDALATLLATVAEQRPLVDRARRSALGGRLLAARARVRRPRADRRAAAGDRRLPRRRGTRTPGARGRARRPRARGDPPPARGPRAQRRRSARRRAGARAGRSPRATRSRRGS